jgi:hypothetical protein
MLRRFVPSRRSLKSFAVAGAWFFIIVSLAHLVWVAGQKWGDPAGATKLYHAVVDGRSYNAWGLTYTGTLGLMLALGQLLLVAAAAGASVLPWPRTLKLRRIGHGVLCGWAALWAINLIWLASVDPQVDSTAQATLLCLLFGCTGYRAATGWSPGRSTTPRGTPTFDNDDADRSGGTHSEDAAGVRVVRVIHTRFRPFVAATRQRTAAGLDRIGDFAHKQAQRLAQTR